MYVEMRCSLLFSHGDDLFLSLPLFPDGDYIFTCNVRLHIPFSSFISPQNSLCLLCQASNELDSLISFLKDFINF